MRSCQRLTRLDNANFIGLMIEVAKKKIKIGKSDEVSIYVCMKNEITVEDVVSWSYVTMVYRKNS